MSSDPAWSLKWQPKPEQKDLGQARRIDCVNLGKKGDAKSQEKARAAYLKEVRKFYTRSGLTDEQVAKKVSLAGVRFSKLLKEKHG